MNIIDTELSFMQKHISYLYLIFILFGCQSEDVVTTHEPKLDYYVDSYDIPDLGFQPSLKVTYEYNSSGKLSKSRVLSYNPDSKSFDELRHLDFAYSGNEVSKILGYLPDELTPYMEQSYEYSPDGRVSKIKETNGSTGLKSEANFVYDDAHESTKVFYTYSNGGSFEYEFNMSGGNVVTDKTTRGSQLCSDAKYTYDDRINPFKNLGYTDYLLTNLSANNKLTESTNYINCAFPSFIPESFSYEYDARGYPTLITTFYKSAATLRKSQKEIFYK
ncbi:MAG TPA: hypothetical protein VFG46_19025 [Chryseolinea sp.]|nr:hypothetical protein [Chryseolinea sp.]